MPSGNLVVRLSDVTGQPVPGRIELEFRRVRGEAGTGGVSMSVDVTGGVTDLTVTGITCRGGPGTLYRVDATCPHFRPYSFFQLIKEDRNNTASDDVEFWIKPSDVTDIRGPQFADLPAQLRQILDNASMQVDNPEDQDLVGASGATLYQRLGPQRKACLLNIAKKASHEPTSGDCLPFIESLLVCRQDRFFANVRSALPERLRRSPLFKSAPNNLHDPLPDFQLAEGSFKTRDAHANLQVTFMRHTSTGALAADIDIDESSGIEHGFEVIGNALFRNRTNPYLIREFMASADVRQHTLTPDYRFVF